MSKFPFKTQKLGRVPPSQAQPVFALSRCCIISLTLPVGTCKFINSKNIIACSAHRLSQLSCQSSIFNHQSSIFTDTVRFCAASYGLALFLATLFQIRNPKSPIRNPKSAIRIQHCSPWPTKFDKTNIPISRRHSLFLLYPLEADINAFSSIQ